MRKISAIIPTYNEEAHIAEAIKSVSWADEVIVVDSFSIDRTPDIVAGFSNVKWVQHEYVNSAAQKNWIIPQAQHNWVFILDADERVTSALHEEILEWKSQPENDVTAYWIKRQNYFMGQKLRYIWKGDAVIRLFRKDKSKYEDLAVHAEVVTKGRISRLKGKIDHHSFLTMERYQDKMERYAQWSAKDYEKKTPKVTIYHLWIKPAYRFIKHYLLQLGILDGSAGFIISKLMAWGVWRRYDIIKKSRDHS